MNVPSAAAPSKKTIMAMNVRSAGTSNTINKYMATDNNNLNTADHDLLIELRTEMKGMRNDIKDIKDGTTARIAALERDKEDKVEIQRLLAEKTKEHDQFITKDEFSPVKSLVYGCVSIILVAFMTAIAYLVINH